MKELKKLTDSDLNKRLDQKRKSLLNLKFNMSGTGKRNSKEAKNLKKEIAQILTEQKIRNK
jgi:large subunit ribosomal protein L29